MLHKTRGGETILISDMTDEHLTNTIKMFINELIELNNLLVNGITLNFDTISAGYKENVSKEKISNQIKSRKEKLQYYIFEACIRGISFTKELQELTGRKVKTSICNIRKQLLTSNIDNDEYNDYDYNYGD